MTSDWVAEPEGHRHLSRWLGGIVAVVVLLAAPLSLVAEEHQATEGQHGVSDESHEAAGDEPSGAEEHEGGQEHGGEHGGGHHFHKNHFAVLLSATEAIEDHGEAHNGGEHGNGHAETHSEGTSSGKDDPDFTIGFDYERRLSQLIGVGGMFDWVVEGRREFLLGPAGILHPFKGSKFWLAPLAERVRETGNWELVVRIGAGWDIPIGKSGKYSIAPNINYDISDEHQLWVVGVAIGKGF